MKKWIALSVALISVASAAPLTRFMPDRPVLTLETGDLQAAEKQLGSLAKDWRAIDFSDLFTNDMKDLPKTLEKSDFSQLITRESVIGVYLGKKSADPAVLLVSRPKIGADKWMATLREEVIKSEKKAGGKVQMLKESQYVFYQTKDLSFGYQNGVAYASNNSDTLRGFLRRLGGSKEAYLAQDKNYANTMNSAGEGVMRAYVDFAQLGSTAQDLLDLGDTKESKDIAKALATLGQLGGSIAIKPDGIQTNIISIPNAQGGDKALYNLLLPKPHAFNLPKNIPATALGMSVSDLDMRGFYDYIDMWVQKLGGTGAPNLKALGEDNLKFDIEKALVSWVGNEFAVATFAADLSKITADDPAASLQGSVFYVEANSKAAAGLKELFDGIATLANEGSEKPMVTQSVVKVNGVSVNKISGEGADLLYTVQDGFVVLAFSEADITRALAKGARFSDDARYKATVSKMPANLVGITYARDNQKVPRSSLRDLISMSFATEASLKSLVDPVTNFVDRLQNRIGGSSGYTYVKNGKVISSSFQQINWK